MNNEPRGDLECGDAYVLETDGRFSNTGPSGVPLSSENRHVGRIYRLAGQSAVKMGIQGEFTGL